MKSLKCIVFLCLFFFMSSCYAPEDFKAYISVHPNGMIDFAYVGKLVSLGLFDKIKRKELEDPKELEEEVAKFQQDLCRDKFFQSVVYEGAGVFKVSYAVRFNIYKRKAFYFVRRNNRILGISLKPDTGRLYIRGFMPVSGQYLQKLMQEGLRVRGALYVRTARTVPVFGHNAQKVVSDSAETKNGEKFYLWNIDFSKKTYIPSIYLGVQEGS